MDRVSRSKSLWVELFAAVATAALVVANATAFYFQPTGVFVDLGNGHAGWLEGYIAAISFLITFRWFVLSVTLMLAGYITIMIRKKNGSRLSGLFQPKRFLILTLGFVLALGGLAMYLNNVQLPGSMDLVK